MEYRDYIRERIKDIEFPARLIVYGPEKDSISTYNRSTYGSCFAEGLMENLENATKWIDSLRYQGSVYDYKILVPVIEVGEDFVPYIEIKEF